jgi:UDP-N-acetylmuramate: L-alanyl-gamma-D-glutamyl-meso-diaminopimelate ligase
MRIDWCVYGATRLVLAPRPRYTTRASMHLHILGICGTFMGGIAAIAREAGHRVTGCDANVYPPMSTQLTAQGIELVEGYGAEQLALGADVYVVGNVVTRGNPLMEEILDRGLPYTSGPQWLAENILFRRPVLAIAGTHGKTTTTAMAAWILEAAGHRPGFLVGGAPLNFDVSARLGDATAPFVIEADEYDTAFFDKRSKFVHYRPRVAVLNNLEFDHADIFPDLAAIETQFHHLVRMLPRSGLIVVNGGDANLARVLERGCYTPVERFGSEGAWQAGPPDERGGCAIDHGGQRIGTLAWDLLGRHNALNALAAIVAARYFGVAACESIQALARFRNVKRRLELIGEAGGIRVYDDFAHHPSAIETTIAGLRARVGQARILAVLEPRSNTMKLGVWRDALAASLDGADRVFCFGGGVGWDVRSAMASLGATAVVVDELEALIAAIAAEARSGDSVLVMSNGGFGGLHAKLIARLANNSCTGGTAG